MKISKLKNPILNYEWGSKTDIPEMSGISPDNKPQAEMWMGAHIKASSEVLIENNWIPLIDLLKKSPVEILGQKNSEKFLNEFPFLFKILAAQKPLSIQSHPDLKQAKIGFEKENIKNILIDDFKRSYKDSNHKPELICALKPFTVLIGFRPLDQIISNLSFLSKTSLKNKFENLKQNKNKQSLKILYQSLMTLSNNDKYQILDIIKQDLNLNTSLEWKWVNILYDHYNNDLGIISPLYLNLITLNPGQALYVPSGELHAYLNGLGIELMANSDNVLRGGLTKKFIDIDELLSILTYRYGNLNIIEPVMKNNCEFVYKTEAEEFELSVIKIDNDDYYNNIRNIQILFCIKGNAIIYEKNEVPIKITKGDSLIVSASSSSYIIKGNATIYKASVHCN